MNNLRGKWATCGEKNTNNFLNLEKWNFLGKKISKLKLSNVEETEDPKKILEEVKSFYKNLYTCQNFDPKNSKFDIFFKNNLLTPPNEELSKCEGMLSEKECHLALKDMENGKPPGSDGLSSEFYKVFWDDINLQCRRCCKHQL